mmetsp:Transcript_81899/g.230521  ORF Transcript_81899/g.230521 Transcript_81899/m.230521 type:complete len:219 (-) Transcript_81899:6-662(-)
MTKRREPQARMSMYIFLYLGSKMLISCSEFGRKIPLSGAKGRTIVPGAPDGVSSFAVKLMGGSHLNSEGNSEGPTTTAPLPSSVSSASLRVAMPRRAAPKPLLATSNGEATMRCWARCAELDPRTWLSCWCPNPGAHQPGDDRKTTPIANDSSNSAPPPPLAAPAPRPRPSTAESADTAAAVAAALDPLAHDEEEARTSMSQAALPQRAEQLQHRPPQ